MFDIADTQQNRDMLREAAEHQRQLTEPFIEWTQKFFIFPRKCYLTGSHTRWFSKVYVGEETCKLRKMFDNNLRRHNKVVYARPEAYTFAVLKEDPRLESIDGQS